MVATRDFSGLTNWVCALASAPASAPMVSLARCMLALHIEEIEADGAGLRSFGPNAVADRLLCVGWHKALQLGLSSLVLEMRRPRPQEDRRKLCPSVGAAHIDDSDRL